MAGRGAGTGFTTGGFLFGGGDDDDGGDDLGLVAGAGDPPQPEPPLPPPRPHCILLQSAGRAASEEHSLEERWSALPGMQFLVPLLTIILPPPAAAVQLGGSPEK